MLSRLLKSVVDWLLQFFTQAKIHYVHCTTLHVLCVAVAHGIWSFAIYILGCVLFCT